MENAITARRASPPPECDVFMVPYGERRYYVALDSGDTAHWIVKRRGLPDGPFECELIWARREFGYCLPQVVRLAKAVRAHRQRGRASAVSYKVTDVTELAVITRNLQRALDRHRQVRRLLERICAS
jgi:hypothetical protein